MSAITRFTAIHRSATLFSLCAAWSLAYTAAISAQDTPPATQPPAVPLQSGPKVVQPAATPKAEFIDPKHDFGEVWVGSELNHTFKIRNTGAGDLQIKNVKPACGCTLAGKYDKIVKPGEIGSVPLKIDSKKLRGTFSKTVRVTSNDPNNTNFNLAISGHVKHYVEASSQMVNFHSLKPREEKSVSVTLTNKGDQPLELTLPEAELTEGFRAELLEKQKGQEYELVVHAKPPYKDGRSFKVIPLTTNLPQQPKVELRLMANVLPRLAVSPDTLVITNASPEKTTRELEITNHGNAPVHLLEATVDEPRLTLEIRELEPGIKYQVVVNIPANYKPDFSGKTITLQLDDPEKQIVKVPVRSTSRPPRPAQLLANKPAPNVEFATHNNVHINTGSIEDEVLVLKFYTSWCGFCKKSLPNMEILSQEYKGRGVRFVNVNMDNPEDARQGRRFTPEQSLSKLEKLGVTYDTAFDADKKIGKAFKVQSFPTLFVINKAGTITNVHLGAIQGPRMDQFRKQLNSVLSAQNTQAAQATSREITGGTQ